MSQFSSDGASMDTTNESNSHSTHSEVGTLAIVQTSKGKETNVDDGEEISNSCDSRKDFMEVLRANGGVPLPQVGMVFQSEDIAYEFYNAYAQRMGFSVRKDKLVRRSNGTKRKRLYVCAKQGKRPNDPRSRKVRKERPQTRTGCKARMCIKFEKDSIWVVTEITSEHNHPLATPSMVNMLRSQKKLQLNVGEAFDTLDYVGMRLNENYENMCEEARRAETLDFMDLDQGKHLSTERMRSLGAGDAQVMLDYFKRKQLANPSFSYSIQVDKDDRMTNFFWADSRSMRNYSYFGDVVCFDTTYRANNYNLPFALFFGVNHHKQVILFGAALLLDETPDSFIWLFEMWLKAMSGRQPKTILTDQCSSMEKAIAQVLPETRHRLCLRHISHNASKHLPSAQSIYPNCQDEFKKCIYGNGTEEDLQTVWDMMLKKYKLVKNKWLSDLYDVREKWALAYGRDTFCADMTTAEQSESINELFKKHLNRNLSLTKFVSSYEGILVYQHEEELREDFHSKQTEPILCVDVPMLKQAAKEYTRKVFEDFQEEFKNWLCCDVELCGEDGTVCTYKVTQFSQQKQCLVMFNPIGGSVTCSCKKFEFEGILCRHVMKVFNHRSIFDFPPQYILKRWTKDAKSGVARYSGIEAQADHQAVVALRCREFCRKASSIAAKVSASEEAHLVAIRCLDKLLEEVEDALKTKNSLQSQTNTSPQQLQLDKRHTDSLNMGQSDLAVFEGRSNQAPVEPTYPTGEVAPDSGAYHSTLPFLLNQSTQRACVARDDPCSPPATSQAASTHNLMSSWMRPFGFPGAFPYRQPFPFNETSNPRQS